MAEQPNIAPVPPADSSSQPSSKPGKPSKPSVKTAVPTASSLLTPRYIPGAPPPKPAAEKKKRQKKTKTPASNDGGSIAAEGDQSDAGVNVSDARSAALTDQAPAKEDIISGRVAGELVATEKEIQEKVVEISDDEPEAELEEWNIFKKAGAVDVLKREIKRLEGRLERAQPKTGKSESKPKQDERPLPETPAFIEAQIQELKELLSGAEAEDAKRTAKQEELLKEYRLADRKAHKKAIKAAVAEAETSAAAKAVNILSFLSLASTITSRSSSRPFTIPLSDSERASIVKAAQVLQDDENASRPDVIDGLLNENSTGEYDGIPCALSEQEYQTVGKSANTEFADARLRALTKSFTSAPTTSPLVETAHPSINGQGAPTGFGHMQFGTAGQVAPAPVPLTFGQVGSSGLEHVHGVGTTDVKDASDVEDYTAEVVEGDSIPSAQAVQQEWVEVKAEDGEASLQTGTAQDTSAVDWAADDMEDELPPIDSLHAKFGTSGQATPVSNVASADVTQVAAAPTPPTMDTAESAPEQEQSEELAGGLNAPAQAPKASDDDDHRLEVEEGIGGVVNGDQASEEAKEADTEGEKGAVASVVVGGAGSEDVEVARLGLDLIVRVEKKVSIADEEVIEEGVVNGEVTARGEEGDPCNERALET
ncbi:hypothetical protein FS837_011590 [Tulasnella sp. UAMH 9824]|nr:hypothetical protein FS837_011590 [Tulasnella sp. UAMH 9824]